MKKVGLILLSLMSLVTVYVSYKVLISYYWQVALVSDWRRSELIIPIEDVEKIDTKFPNLTTAALPLAAMKMRYYIREENFDTLETLLKKSKSDNPYMGVGENIFSQYLYNIKRYDSAYNLAISAFNKLSNNQLHGSVLISTLIKLDSLDKAMEIFENIKYKDKAHYSLLLRSLVEAKDTIYLKKYLDESRELIGENEEFRKYEQMQKVTYDNYYNSDGYNQMAKIDFDKGFTEQSIIKYKKSITYNPFNSNSYLNLGKIYFKTYNDSIITAKKMFAKAIEFDSSNGEAYYYLGISEYIINKISKDSICKILKKSLDFDYKDSRPIIKQYGCVF